ncbi:hypothetical protein ACIHAX_35225 [Nocardia sp. NPDC051929]|uniref:hypothetical protein n=1 Tax=Nocardia sp. NPDC051929 TaxID=3364327 RepID=UPI0037C85871
MVVYRQVRAGRNVRRNALDPLYLPPPASAFIPCRHTDLSPRGVPWHTSISATAYAPPSVEDAAVYRWILGHHASFCVWRLLAQALRDLSAGSKSTSALVDRTALLLDAYSVLILYAGSCSTEIHGKTIRPLVMAADPAFSDRWARDYEPVHPLLREISATHHLSKFTPLSNALKSNLIVHRAAAAHLVPNGESLLRKYSDDPMEPPTEAQQEINDRVFLVERIPICSNEFFAQFATRLGQVRSDLVHRPLPVPCGWAGLPSAHADVVTRFHRESGRVLSKLEGSL